MAYEQQFNGQPPAEQWTAVPAPPTFDPYTGEAPGEAPGLPPSFAYEHGGPNTAGVGTGSMSQNSGNP